MSVTGDQDDWKIVGDEALPARTAYFLTQRSAASLLEGGPEADLGDWDHDAAMERTVRVREVFENPILRPFDNNAFFGSWKWVNWTASDLTMTGRWIMNALLIKDTRAVALCIDWLADGPFAEIQSKALRYALSVLTGQTFSTDREWLDWYEEQGKETYPEPDYGAWWAEVRP